MVRFIDAAETARMLRAALKAEFPGVRFSVRTSRYAGGASIDVRWVDGPTEEQVRALARLFEGATFDPMLDLKEYVEALLAGPSGELERVRFGADHVFEHRSLSEELLARCEGLVQDNGRTSQPMQCEGCGDWMDPGDCYTTPSPHRSAFVCSRRCGARKAARHVDARTFEMIDDLTEGR